MIGDRLSDVMAGHAAACTTVLLETGMHEAPPIESPAMSIADPSARPDAVFARLTDAVDWIIARPQ